MNSGREKLSERAAGWGPFAIVPGLQPRLSSEVDADKGLSPVTHGPTCVLAANDGRARGWMGRSPGEGGRKEASWRGVPL